MRLPFSLHPLQCLLLVDFSDDGHSDQYEVIPHLNWEIGFDTCTVLILCIKLITNENLLYGTGNSMHCGDLKGKEIQKGGYIYIYEGNGNLLQYSCLENPMDAGAWQAAVCGVTKSQT